MPPYRLCALAPVFLVLLLIGCGGGSSGSKGSSTTTGTATVDGYIFSPDGQTPIGSATVALADRNRSPLSTTTDQNGYFKFEKVTSGDKTLTVTAGVVTYTKTVTVAKTGTTSVSTQTKPIKIGTDTGSSIVHFAVVAGNYDKIEDVLTKIGFVKQDTYDATKTGWSYIELTDMNATTLAKYNAVFVNCGASNEDDMTVDEQAALKTFVQNGGMLYASDYAYEVVELIWPHRIDFYGDDTQIGSARNGMSGSVTATVNTPLDKVLGKTTMTVQYNLGYWVMVDKAPETTDPTQAVTVLVQGPRPTGSPNESGNYPIMMQFKDNKGTVVYTSFHNEAQVSDDMTKVLSRIAFGGL